MRFPQAPITLWESDPLPAIDPPVANAMNEKRMNVQCIAAGFKISRWPRLISYQKGGLPNGSPKLSVTSVLAEASPQEDPQVAARRSTALTRKQPNLE